MCYVRFNVVSQNKRIPISAVLLEGRLAGSEACQLVHRFRISV